MKDWKTVLFIAAVALAAVFVYRQVNTAAGNKLPLI